MSIEIKKEILESFVNGVNAIANEATMQISATNGFETVVLDPSEISLVVAKIPKQCFKKWQTENATMGLDFTQFKSQLKNITKEANITLAISENKQNLIIQETGTPNLFILPILDLEANTLPIPLIEFKAHAEINAKDFKDCLKTLKDISNYVKIKCNGNFLVEAKSAKGQATKQLMGIISGTEATALYPAPDYLQPIITVFKKEEICFNFSTNTLCNITGCIDGVNLSYFLAPRMETEPEATEPETIKEVA